MRLGTEFYPKYYQYGDRRMPDLRDTWDKFAVDDLLETLKARFEKPEQIHLFRANGKEIKVHRPFIAGRHERVIEGRTHFDKASKFEADMITDTIYKREYALVLSADGFFARFRNNRPKFIERPSRMHSPKDLEDLLGAHITAEKSREPDFWLIWSDNTPQK